MCGGVCDIVTALAAESMLGADQKATALRKPEATLLGAVCATVTALAAKALDRIVVACRMLAGNRATYTGEHMAIWLTFRCQHAIRSRSSK